MKDRLRFLSKGERIPEEQWTIHTTLLKAENMGVGCWMDSTGIKVARQVQRKATATVKAKLTANLDCASGSTPGSATALRQRLGRSTKTYENDPAYPDEITVYETQGAFCGVEGEIVEVKNAGSDDEGNTIWEVVRGGATWHLASIAEGASAATLTINGVNASVAVDYPFGSSSSDTYGTIGISYDFDSATWNATGASC